MISLSVGGARGKGSCEARSKCLEGILLLSIDGDELADSKYVERLVELRIESTKYQAAAGSASFFVESDEMTEHHRAQFLHSGDV